MAELAGVVQHRQFGIAQELVEEAIPIGQTDVLPAHGAELGLIQEHHGDAVEGVDLPRVQIVLGGAHVLLEHAAAFPRVDAHVWLGGIGALANDFRCGQAGCGVVHLVLHGGEEALGGLFAFAVVRRHCEDFADALVNARLAGADFADARQQFIEMIHRAEVALEAFVVQHEALDQIFGQPRRGPLAELGAARGADAVADGQNGFQPVVLGPAGDTAPALLTNL